MSQNSLSLTLRQTKMGWCLFINGEPYAVGMRSYCIKVADTVRRDFARGGAAMLPPVARKKGGSA